VFFNAVITFCKTSFVFENFYILKFVLYIKCGLYPHIYVQIYHAVSSTYLTVTFVKGIARVLLSDRNWHRRMYSGILGSDIV